MDIQEKQAFEIAFDNKLGARGCQFDLDEDGNYEDRETLCGWHMWLEAKAQTDQKIKSLLCDEHLKKCESPTGIFNSQYSDEEPCLICLAKQAKAQAVPGWVSVETDLPREDQDILFYLDIDDVILDGYYSSNTFIAAHSTHLRSDVSHWMYHPLPPTTQEPTNDRN
ncbi:hypothetical protein [Acinetobacter sp. YH12045]|uniref:hypothetical protein n=1 Tax=Acinetobacter sp. YH12045 TaxID=2601051 RepID=UPI0015D3945C|nr:hypothetical protein [Acinetobacter sp. YH12045]